MRTLAKLWDGEAHTTTTIFAKVEGKVVVEVVSPRELPIDNQFQIMAHTATSSIDTTIVVEFCSKVRCGVHIASIHKRLGVQITEYRGTNRVVLTDSTSIEQETVVLTMKRRRAIVAHSIERHQSVAFCITHVLGHSKGKVENAIPDAV